MCVCVCVCVCVWRGKWRIFYYWNIFLSLHQSPWLSLLPLILFLFHPDHFSSKAQSLFCQSTSPESQARATMIEKLSSFVCGSSSRYAFCMSEWVCEYMCVYEYIYIYIDVFVCLCVCMHICMYVIIYMYVFLYVYAWGYYMVMFVLFI